jgi:membrane dipeptidase
MNNTKKEWSRRKFVTTVTGAGAALMFHPLWSWAMGDADSKVAAIVAKTMGIDVHNHIDVPLDGGALPSKVDLAGEMRRSGLTAIVMTFATDYKRDVLPGEAYQRFINGLNGMDEVLKNNNMTRALNLADLKTAHQNHQPIVIQSVEGSHFLEGKLERVEVAYKRGLRHLGLLHDSDASVPLGDVYTNPPKFGGLTSLGTDVIKECNRLGILIDLAHASNDTIDAALKITTKPVIISHTGLNTRLGQDENRAKMMMPRLISKEQAKVVADAGGVIGVWTHLADTPLDYAQNIRALVDIIGVDHVCIGTDTKLTPAYRAPGDFGPKPPQKMNDDNKHQNQNRVGERTNEAWANEKTGFYYAVVDALLQAGFNEEEIGKIGGGNYCRVFDAATAGH